MSDALYIVAALLLIAALQGWNWSKIERLEAEYEVLKKLFKGGQNG